MRSGYLGEIAAAWRPLLAACLGVGTGLAVANYTANLFAPYLIAEFRWRREEFALVGTIGLVLLLVMPLAGRAADRFGVRRVASIGVISLPITFFALSLMNGSIYQFFAIHGIQLVFGSLTTTTIFSRLVAERLDIARGFGLSLIMTGPPLVSALATPILAAIIELDGWRAGYRALALISAIGGGVAIVLAPRMISTKRPLAALAGAEKPSTLESLRALLRLPAFLLIGGGVFLCNLPQTIASNQLSLVLGENGISAVAAAWLLSLFAIAVLAGRFGFGLLLDRLPARAVAAAAMGLPSIGFLGIALPYDPLWLLAACVLLIGVAQGAEGDVAAFLVARFVGLANYSFAFGLVMALLSAATAIGSLILSATLAFSGSFQIYVILSALVTTVGASFFGFLGGSNPVSDPAGGCSQTNRTSRAAGEFTCT